MKQRILEVWWFLWTNNWYAVQSQKAVTWSTFK